MTEKRIPLCGKCANKILAPGEAGAQELVGCKSDTRVKDYDTAKQFCPVVNWPEWKVTTYSGYAGGSDRKASLNLLVQSRADTAEEVRLKVQAVPELIEALSTCAREGWWNEWEEHPTYAGLVERLDKVLEAARKALDTLKP